MSLTPLLYQSARLRASQALSPRRSSPRKPSSLSLLGPRVLVMAFYRRISACKYTARTSGCVARLRHSHYSDLLPASQPVGIGFSSPHLTVASLLSCRVTLLATPPGRRITVVSIRGIVTQRHEVHYKKSGKVICPDDKRCVLRIVDMSVPPSPTPSRSSSYKSQEDASHRALTMSNLYDGKSFDDRPNRLFTSDPKPLAEVGPSEVFHHARILRVPDGLFLRPSTPAGSSEEPIVVKHLLSAEIRYLIEGETEEKILTISKDIDLGHVSDSLLPR